MNSFSSMPLHYQCAVLIISAFALYNVVRGLHYLSQKMINSKGNHLPKLFSATGFLCLFTVVFWDLSDDVYVTMIMITIVQFLIAIMLVFNRKISDEIDNQGRSKGKSSSGTSTMDIYDLINQKVAMIDGVYAYFIKSLVEFISRFRKG